MTVPRVGEAEPEGAAARGRGGKRYVHKGETTAKPLHKLNKDYERKSRQLSKKMEARVPGGGHGEPPVSEGGAPGRARTKAGANGGKDTKKGSRYSGKPIGRVRSELKSAEQIRKSRLVAERRKAKNARPSKKRGRG